MRGTVAGADAAGHRDQRLGPVGERATRPVRTGGLADRSTTSCRQVYSPGRIAERDFAFDGTVVSIAAGRTDRPGRGHLETSSVTFTVTEWWRGGSGGTVTVDMLFPAGGRSRAGVESPAAFAVGTRLLVSGQDRWGGAALDDPIAWPCGFTRYYDERTATAWRSASR